MLHTETLREHTDEVLHVSFAHGGHLFSTTSKDATLRVRNRLNITKTLAYHIHIFINKQNEKIYKSLLKIFNTFLNVAQNID